MAERLMDALEAGQAKGGDTRGMQAAGILVVAPITSAEVTTDRVIDIRVDDYPDPFKELRRVLNVRLSGSYVQRSAAFAKEGKTIDALEMQKLAAKMHPRSERILFGLAERYAYAGERLNALLALRQAIELQPSLKQDAAESPAFLTMKEHVEFTRLLGE
jgi:tetratricopeptide (TPR) repeat protein